MNTKKINLIGELTAHGVDVEASFEGGNFSISDSLDIFSGFILSFKKNLIDEGLTPKQVKQFFSTVLKSDVMGLRKKQ